MKTEIRPETFQTKDKWLHRFAVATAVMTVLLICAGALVTSTKSGDAIPDWPTSYGSLIPSHLAGGVLVEWIHRLIAGITAILILALSIWLAFGKLPRWVKALGAIAVVSVLAQALLGGLRVLIPSNEQVQEAVLRLIGGSHVSAIRIGFTVAHAALAQIVLGLAFAIALVTKPNFVTAYSSVFIPLSSRRFLLGYSVIVAILIFGQLILGAVIRHNDAGLIIPDFPTSFGRIVLNFSDLPFDPNNPQRMTYGEFVFKVGIHFAHRVNAFLIAVLIFGLFWIVCKLRVISHEIRKFIVWQLGLVTTQLLFGALVIWTKLSVPFTVSHVAIGATLLGISVVTIFQIWCATICGEFSRWM